MLLPLFAITIAFFSFDAPCCHAIYRRTYAAILLLRDAADTDVIMLMMLPGAYADATPC